MLTTDQKRKAVKVMRERNVVLAVWQVCPCQLAVIRFSVRLLTRSCLYASQNAAAAPPGLTWSMDFVMDALAAGRRIKCLT